MHGQKGKYYNLIRKIVGRPKRLYGSQVKEVFETLPYFLSGDRRVDESEFVRSMKWVLADLFGEGSDKSPSENLFGFMRTHSAT